VFRGAGLVTWKLVYTKQAQKDAKKIRSAGLKEKTVKLLDIIKEDHFKSPPCFEKLLGDLKGAYSRRINIQHRIVYQVIKEKKIVKIIKI
jgi:Txe/YoeB family toxin of toxin-antitoxin system